MSFSQVGFHVVREAVPGESMIVSGSDPAEFERSYQEVVAQGNTSVPAMIEISASRNPKAPALCEKRVDGYKTTTYEELIMMSKSLAKALAEGDFCPEIKVDGKPMRFLGTYMTNRPEFVCADLACFYMGAISISLFEEPYDHLLYITNDASFDTVILQPNYARQFVKLIAEKTIRPMKNFILTEDLDSETKAAAEKLGIRLWTMAELIEKGKKLDYALPQLEPDRVAALLVTSGSTGYPKAVMLKHKSLIYLHVGHWPTHFRPGETMMANLNYAFGTSKLSIMMCLSVGGRVIFFGNQPEKTLEVMRETNPNFAIFPPIFLHKVHGMAMQTINQLPAAQKAGVLAAIEAKIKFIKEHKSVVCPELDKHLAPLRQKLFGTGLRNCYFIGASVREDTLWFFRAILGCPLYNLYGLTESGNWCMMSSPWSQFDSVGSPLQGFEFKVVDLKHCGYTTKDVINGKPTPRGELYVRGGSLFAGYLKDPKKTKEAFSPDGWLMTKDIVSMNLEDMSFTIIDRVNNVRKISNEEFVTVELLEKYYEESQFVSQAYVHATSDKDYLVIVACPKRDFVFQWAKVHNVTADFHALCKNEELAKSVLADLHDIAKRKKLNSYEYISKVYLTPEPFTQENGLLTFSYKLRRANIVKMYQDALMSMYSATVC